MPIPTLATEKPRTRTLVGYPGEVGRFTLDGSDELESHLARICEGALTGIRQIIPNGKLKGLFLGGDYGRGEGGVWPTEDGDRPYNDFAFYVFIRGQDWLNERRFSQRLRRLAHALGPAAGVAVNFKILSPDKLRRSPPSMFYYDLVAGHRWIMGDRNLLAGCTHHQAAYAIPLSEATRLLMNRCSGLLFAKERLERESFTDADADFVTRNLAKAQLAFGDVVLTVFGQYHWSCRERYSRLLHFPAIESWPWFSEVCRHHRAGVGFKLHPSSKFVTRETLQGQLAAISAVALEVWLWLESRRLNHCFTSAREYALHSADKCPGTNPWCNRLVNLKAFGLETLFQKNSHRHPYEKILNALVIILWTFPSTNSVLWGHLRETLSFSAGPSHNPATAYRLFWQRFN